MHKKNIANNEREVNMKKLYKIIIYPLITICLFACTNKDNNISSPIKSEYTGKYHTILDYDEYLKYHGFFINSDKLLDSNNNYEAHEYSLGGDTYQIIALNNIEYAFDSYSSNNMYNGSLYCDDKSSCAINLNDYFYIYDNILFSLNTPEVIIENLKTNPIKDSSNIDYYKDGKIFTIDEFIETCNLDTKEIVILENNDIGIDTFLNVQITFEDDSQIVLYQIDEDYVNKERNDISDQIVHLYNTSCFLNDYCIKEGIGEGNYIVCQNLILKVIKDNGRDFESFFRNMNY